MEFTDRCSTSIALDAHKRVLFSHGLVLGESEFRAEQHYFLEKHRRHNRALHGYGTVAGLDVTWRSTTDGPEVRVSAGLAVDPHGREICVPEPQCALLNDWLLQRRQAGGSPPLDASPPGHVSAYVTLCYRECETDKVPIPVGPCFSLDKSAVASRIQDAFELKLTDTRPAEAEEDAVAALRAVLAHVRVASESGALTTPDALVAEVRALLPDSSPPAAPASPPADLVLHPQFASSIIRTAMRVFVTEVLPQLVPDGGGCLNGPRDGTCVLLARLDFDVVVDVSDIPRVSGAVTVSQDERPLLLHTHLFQQAFVTSSAPSAPPMLHPVPLSSTPPAPAASVSRSGFEIAAAGVVRGDGTADGPVLNNLRVVSAGSGEAVFTFDGYREPDGSFQYIVKVHTVSAPPRTPVPTARFLEFRPGGFAIRVTRGNTAVAAADIPAIPFMIEISRIE